jgi:hypothetical protein|nr:MAG TPA: hypothetical protein [Caudoviricetes sp.]
MKNPTARRFLQDDTFTAYDDKGDLIVYHNLDDVPPEKRADAVSEKVHRAVGDEAFLQAFNDYRRKKAMGFQAA